MKKKCFVIQRFDGDRYDRLYKQVFKPAIEAAGFIPYRVDNDPGASIPIESIEREIFESDACFAEISEDAPNVWYELGYSVAKEKPLCLVCSSARMKFPFDVQHRQIIRYPEHPVPDDFTDLHSKIRSRLESILSNELTLQQNTQAAKALSVGPDTGGLKAHELLALTIIFQGKVTQPVSGWTFANEMERAGYTGVASGLAMTALIKDGYIAWKNYEDERGDDYPVLATTPKGDEWLIVHQEDLNLRIEKPKTDDDIPF